MTITNALKNSWKYLPVLSVYNRSFTHPENLSPIEIIGHAAYAAITVGLLGFYLSGLVLTRELNPITQRRVITQIRIQQEKKQKDYQDKYNRLQETLFGKNGLADSNHDGKISIEEKARAFGIMGLESQINFPEPSAEQLEKTVRSYQGEK